MLEEKGLEKEYDDNKLMDWIVQNYPQNPREEYDPRYLIFPQYCSVECGDKINVNSFSECCSVRGMVSFKNYIYEFIENWRTKMLKKYSPNVSQERKIKFIRQMVSAQKEIDDQVDINKKLIQITRKNGQKLWLGLSHPEVTVRVAIRYMLKEMELIAKKIIEIVSAPLARRSQIMDSSLDGFTLGYIAGGGGFNGPSGGSGDGELLGLVVVGIAALIGGAISAVDESVRGDYLAFMDYIKVFTVLMFRYESYYYTLGKILRYKYMQKQKGKNRYAYYTEIGDKNVASGPVGGAGFSMSRRRSRSRSRTRRRSRSKSRSKSRSRRKSRSRSKTRSRRKSRRKSR